MAADLKQEVVSWNVRFPVDRWWRMKQIIPFLSPAHREASFLDQLFEYEEDKFFTEMAENKEEADAYVPGSGDIFKAGTASVEGFAKEAQAEIDKMLKAEQNGGE